MNAKPPSTLSRHQNSKIHLPSNILFLARVSGGAFILSPLHHQPPPNEARLKAIADERQAIFDAFPDLRDEAESAKRTPFHAAAHARKRRGMSAAERKAVGTRMKAYWAKRRAEKAGGEAATADRATESSATAKRPSKRKGMSAEARKAVGQRMRAYWAARRAEKQAGGRKRAGQKAGRKK